MNNKELKNNRENLMKLIYQYDFYHSDSYDKEDIYDEDVLNSYQSLLSKLESIDKLIEASLFDYSMSRLNSVDRAIIRVATYEMLSTETPFNIIINEAIELTKEFSDLDDERQHKFTNKVLDTIAKSIK